PARSARRPAERNGRTYSCNKVISAPESYTSPFRRAGRSTAQRVACATHCHLKFLYTGVAATKDSGMAIALWMLTLAGALLWPLATATAAAGEAPRSAGSFSIEPWTNEKGLPENSVVAMTQTRDGYLWVGTLSGLARFDGIQFTVFDEVNTPGLGSSRIVSLFEDSEGTLWIGTDSAGIYRAREGELSRFEGLGDAGSGGRVMSICEDSLGAVWLCTAEGELARHYKGTVDVWRAGP